MTAALSSSADYLVPDLLRPGLRLVLCGTAPSRKSAETRAYYAKPGNRFWSALHETGITPRRFLPQEYAGLLELGIGLTDLCKTHAGVDSEIPPAAFDRPAFLRKMRRCKPRLIAFTSKNAARLFLGRQPAYGLQTETVGDTCIFVLCSPSGLATRFFDIAVWHALAETLAEVS